MGASSNSFKGLSHQSTVVESFFLFVSHPDTVAVVAFHAAATLSLAARSAPAAEPATTSFSTVRAVREAAVAISAVVFVASVPSDNLPRYAL